MLSSQQLCEETLVSSSYRWGHWGKKRLSSQGHTATSSMTENSCNCLQVWLPSCPGCRLAFSTWLHGAFLGESPRNVCSAKSAHWPIKQATILEPPQVGCHASDASHVTSPLFPWLLLSLPRERGRWQQNIASNSKKTNSANLTTSMFLGTRCPSGYQVWRNSSKRDQGEARKM